LEQIALGMLSALAPAENHMNHSVSRDLQVSWRYELRFCQGAFRPENRILEVLLRPDLSIPSRSLVFVDQGVLNAWPTLSDEIIRWFSLRCPDFLLASAPVAIVGGEACKQGLGLVEQVARIVAEHNLCRHSNIIMIGGGAVLDAVGLGASLAHRGLRQIRLPTTTLSQCDGGLGVKNGVNFLGQKNFLGTFTPPDAVVNDAAFLPLLSDRQWRAGISEALKVAIIKDETFLRDLLLNAHRFAQRDESAMQDLISRSALLHLDHIVSGGDPFEKGSSRPLDFGHWAAHRLEVLSNHALGHGEAVAIGLALDLSVAIQSGDFPQALGSLVFDALEIVGFELWHSALSLRDADGRRSVFKGLEQFREHLGGTLTLAMPDGPGRRQDIHHLDPEMFDLACETLEARHHLRKRAPGLKV
jgi:3-dehydroquinate synthase